MYATSRIKSIFTTFAILAILVVCSLLKGTFRLYIWLSNAQRNESICKVLELIQTIFKLLTKKLILIVIVFSCCYSIAYYLMQNWLQDYEYRIEMSWSVFAVCNCATAMFSEQ
jgi:putative ABC transport system permease protein